MRKREQEGSGVPALLAAAVCLLLTLCLILPEEMPGRLLKSLPRAGASEGILLRLRAEDDAAVTAAPRQIVSETQPLTEPALTEAPETAPGTEEEMPPDILAAREAYLEAYRDAEPYGTVNETFFGNKSATDVVGNVGIRNCTSTKTPDFAALLAQGAPLSVEDPAAPTVLIFHTHTTESYLPADNGVFYKGYSTHSSDQKLNIVRVGDALCRALEAHGVGVIHDTQVYDAAYNGAYSRSRVTVERYLQEYPSIQVTIDVHRDAVYYSDVSACKPTAEIDGKKAAQIMIITGAEEGLVTSFPDWEENLRFALALQKKAQDKYEGLMKPVYFCQRKYNMDLTPCSLLLEFGSDTNTLEEAVYAGRLLGDSLGELISEYAEKEADEK